MPLDRRIRICIPCPPLIMLNGPLPSSRPTPPNHRNPLVLQVANPHRTRPVHWVEFPHPQAAVDANHPCIHHNPHIIIGCVGWLVELSAQPWLWSMPPSSPQSHDARAIRGRRAEGAPWATVRSQSGFMFPHLGYQDGFISPRLVFGPGFIFPLASFFDRVLNCPWLCHCRAEQCHFGQVFVGVFFRGFSSAA